jgi:hypothetical protein
MELLPSFDGDGRTWMATTTVSRGRSMTVKGSKGDGDGSENGMGLLLWGSTRGDKADGSTWGGAGQ